MNNARTQQRRLNALFTHSHQAVAEFLRGEEEGFYSAAFAPFRPTVFAFRGLTFSTSEEARAARAEAVATLAGIEGAEAARVAAVAMVSQHYATERSRILNQG